jgi:hypothetical protein
VFCIDHDCNPIPGLKTISLSYQAIRRCLNGVKFNILCIAIKIQYQQNPMPMKQQSSIGEKPLSLHSIG